MIGSIPDAAIGTIFAAFIAALVSLLGLIISKEQKTSEFRQVWIDALRSDLSTYLTQINAIQDAVMVSYKDLASKISALRPFYTQLNAANFNILLRVNPSERNSQRLLDAMEAFNVITADESNLTTDNVKAVEAEFIAASQVLLKAEWRRVKSGERTFRIAKGLALLVIIGALIAGIFVTHHVYHSAHSNMPPVISNNKVGAKSATTLAPAPATQPPPSVTPDNANSTESGSIDSSIPNLGKNGN